MEQNYDVVVVGAGITGLVTAYKLYKQGLKVKLLERNSRVGGVINSSKVDGFLLEYGPNSFQESDEINQLVDELNLKSEFATTDPKMPRYVYFQGKLQPAPLSPPTLISSKLLSLQGKLRILAEPLISKRKNLTEESIASFVSRRLGREVHDRLVSPFVSGVYAGNTETLSLAASFPMLAELENNYGSIILGAIKSRKASTTPNEPKKLAKRLCSFNSGLAVLPKSLASHLDDALALNCQIQELTINKEKPYYKLKVQHKDNIEQLTTNHLVLATPAYTSAKLLENHLPNLAKELQAIEYVPMVIVHLSLSLSELEQGLNGFGFLVPRSEKIRLLGSIWSSSLFPDRAPKGQALLTNFIGGALDRQAVELSNEDLGHIVSQDIKNILGLKILPNLVSVYKYKQAIPQYNLGHLSRLALIESELKAHSGLYLASNYLKGVSVGDCASRGQKLAESIKLNVHS